MPGALRKRGDGCQVPTRTGCSEVQLMLGKFKWVSPWDIWSVKKKKK